MYTPKHFDSPSDAFAIDAMRANNFAIVVSQDAEGVPVATHCPLMISDDGKRLSGHVARANPHWALWDRDARVLAIFPARIPTSRRRCMRRENRCRRGITSRSTLTGWLGFRTVLKISRPCSKR